MNKMKFLLPEQKRLLALLGIGTAYLISVHWAYVIFVSPLYDYAGYNYYEHEVEMYIFGYIVSLLPLCFYRPVRMPSNFGAIVLYSLCYAPGQLMMLFMWFRSTGSLIAVMLAWMVSMCFIFRSASISFVQSRCEDNVRTSRMALPHSIGAEGRAVILALTISATASTVYLNIGHLSFVNFEDVYDLRFQSVDAGGWTIYGYLNMWLSYLFIPYYLAIGLVEKRFSAWGIALGASLIIYMSIGAKAALLLPLVMFIYDRILSRKSDVLATILLCMTCLSVGAGLLDDADFLMTKAMVFLRTLGVTGWTMTMYYDYFTDNGYTYYTHINGIRQMFSSYTHGNYGLGQLIGMEHSGSVDANFNANFWASDGLAALGVFGIFVVTFFVCSVMILINYVSVSFESRFVSLLFVGFWSALANGPLTTALVSGGGAMAICLLWINRNRMSGIVPDESGSEMSDPLAQAAAARRP